MINLFCMGDSLTYGFYPYFLKQIIRAEKKDINILNLGIKGYNSGQYLQFLKKNIDFLPEYDKRYSVLLLGTNDIRLGLKFTLCKNYEKNMEKIINLLKAHNFIILMSMIPPITKPVFPYYTSFSINRIRSCINPFIVKISHKYQLPLIDNYNYMMDQNFPDGVHPDMRGYKKMAENCFKVLWRSI